MGTKYWIKLAMILVQSLLWANVPFVMLGMFLGFLPALLLSIWLASIWSWKDSPLFVIYKTGTVGFFSIALMELSRSHYLIKLNGMKHFWEHVFNYVTWSLIPLALLCLSMGVLQIFIKRSKPIDQKSE